jgi:FlaG/FlaF family flagellin (archaellin)
MSTLAKILMLACTNAMAASISTGITGTVYVSPAHPGPQRVGESGRKPMSAAKVQVLDANRRVVAHAVTDADGKFSVALAAGEYSVEVDTGGAALPRCGSAEANVQDGHVAQIELSCDSGMR